MDHLRALDADPHARHASRRTTTYPRRRGRRSTGSTPLPDDAPLSHIPFRLHALPSPMTDHHDRRLRCRPRTRTDPRTHASDLLQPRRDASSAPAGEPEDLATCAADDVPATADPGIDPSMFQAAAVPLHAGSGTRACSRLRPSAAAPAVDPSMLARAAAVRGVPPQWIPTCSRPRPSVVPPQ